MIIRVLFAVVIILPLTSVCQTSAPKSSKKISIGFSFSPDYCYRTLNTNSPDRIVLHSRNDTEIPRFGYTTGLKISTGPYNRFSFDLGVLFSDKGEKTRQTPLTWGQPDPSLPTKAKIVYHYYYIDIPLKASYYFTKRQQEAFFISAGFSPNIFLEGKNVAISEYSDGHTSKSKSSTHELSTLNLSFTAGFGYHVNLSKNLFLKIEPTFRHSITLIKEAPIKQYQYSAGLDFSVYYKL